MKRTFKVRPVKKGYQAKEAYFSPIIKTAKDYQEYDKWNAKLAKEGLRIIDEQYRNAREYTTKRDLVNKPVGIGAENLEYYSVLKSYCEYFKYDVKTAIAIKEVLAGRRRNTRTAFKKMLRMYVNGLSMDDAYRAVSADYGHNIKSAIHFKKYFQKLKREFLSIYPKFSGYIEYVKYCMQDPISFEEWASIQ